MPVASLPPSICQPQKLGKNEHVRVDIAHIHHNSQEFPEGYWILIKEDIASIDA
jgi:hypothetical protein